MDTTNNGNQIQIETYESKLITINGTSSVPTEHIYKVRKTYHPQATNNQFHINKTQNSSTHSINLLCQICNKQSSITTGRYCACQERLFHLQCLIAHIYQDYKQGNQIMQCSYCNIFYPTDIESNFTFSNLNKTERIQYLICYFIFLLIIVAEIMILIFVHMNTSLYIVLAILFVIELLGITILIRKTVIKCKSVKFRLKEYRYGDEIIQFLYANNSIQIISALKNNKLQQQKNLI